MRRVYILGIKLKNYKFENSNSLTNDDLKPIIKERRTWKTVNYATLWMGIIHNIPTYATVGGLIALGLSPWQTLGIIITASLILYVALTLNGHAGTKFGVPFPVLIRSSFGVIGANIPAMLRAFVAIMWFGIQTYAGSTAINILIQKLWPSWNSLGGNWSFFGLHLSGMISFLLFWALHLFTLNHGMESIKKFEVFAGPMVYLVFGGMVFWAISIAGGLGPIYSQPGKFRTFKEAFWPFVAGVTGVISIWATLILNIPDFTRFAESQEAQKKGQFLGLPGTFALFAFASITVTSGTQVAYGKPIWNIVDVLSRFDSPFVIAAAVITLCIAAMSVNVASNMVSPAYDIANLFPKYVNFKRGAYITAILAVFTFPWKTMESATNVMSFLGTIGGALGPVAGIMFADYFIIRKQELNVDDLYALNGEYTYNKGYNYRAFIATLIGAFFALIGDFIPSLKSLSNISWFVGVAIAAIVYVVLMKIDFPNIKLSTINSQK